MEDVGFVSQLQLATCPALGEVTHVQLLAGVSELGGTSRLSGAASAGRVSSSC